jgi:hypothetical protein
MAAIEELASPWRRALFYCTKFYVFMLLDRCCSGVTQFRALRHAMDLSRASRVTSSHLRQAEAIRDMIRDTSALDPTRNRNHSNHKPLYTVALKLYFRFSYRLPYSGVGILQYIRYLHHTVVHFQPCTQPDLKPDSRPFHVHVWTSCCFSSSCCRCWAMMSFEMRSRSPIAVRTSALACAVSSPRARTEASAMPSRFSMLACLAK